MARSWLDNRDMITGGRITEVLCITLCCLVHSNFKLYAFPLTFPRVHSAKWVAHRGCRSVEMLVSMLQTHLS